MNRDPLTEDDLARMEHRARRFQGAYTGTSGTLAADVMRLLGERLRLLEELAKVRGGEPPRPAGSVADEYLDSLR